MKSTSASAIETTKHIRILQQRNKTLEKELAKLKLSYLSALNDHQDTLAKLLELQEKHLDLLDRVQQLMKEQS